MPWCNETLCTSESGKATTIMKILPGQSSPASLQSSSKARSRILLSAIALVALLTIGWLALAGCGSGVATSAAGSGVAMINTTMSDPATCMAPNGPYQHVYVTITDVKASTNADAAEGDSSFVDLTPALPGKPRQIDLLGLAGNNCLLATLGDPLQLQAGTYQQIRLYLAPNSASIANNACSGAANCVVLNDGSTHTLQLSSEARTGIKISSEQISSGGVTSGFTVAAGQTKDLNIDFNTCISIVTEGNGEYRLKPVLHAGEVSATSNSINGTVVDSTTGKAVAGPVMVALEQKDSAGIDRVYMTTMADSTGAFVFCPLPAGSYDLVIVGESTAGAAYSPTVVTGVSPGQTLATVQLYAQTSAAGAAATPLTLNGTITSAGSAAVASPVDLQVSFLETVTGNLVVTVPVLPTSTQVSAVLTLATSAATSCAAGTDCVNYSAVLSNGTPYVGAYASGGSILARSTVAAAYTVDAMAFQPLSGGTLDCTTSDLTSSAVQLGSATTANASTIAFAGCQ